VDIHLDTAEQCRTAAGYVSNLEAKLASNEWLSWDEQLLLAALARDALIIATAACVAQAVDDPPAEMAPPWLKTLQEDV
jgi:hypothetical protein